jgi:hypothetical protein
MSIVPPEPEKTAVSPLTKGPYVVAEGEAPQRGSERFHDPGPPPTAPIPSPSQ